MAYSEQDGAKRQVGGKIRDGPHCQARAIKMKICFISYAYQTHHENGEVGPPCPQQPV